MTTNDPAWAAALLPLVGTWRGTGTGHFPTIDDFAYEEEVTFTATAKPVLAYRQRTWIGDVAMHAESGFLRWLGDGDMEWVVAQPTGIVEAAAGTLSDDSILRVDAAVLGTPTAVAVSEIRREYRFGDESVDYDLWMATSAVPSLTHHLAAHLARVPE